MESILARALEYTLKYWLKSFSRDQFKLQGRTVQLSNLDINGDALHASAGLPPALNVATATVGKLEIRLPSVSNVQIEPIVVQIDRLDLVLEENSDPDVGFSNQSTAISGKSGGYGFADKIADGMTIEVGTVNLMLETRGGVRRQGGATWASPLASVTIRNLLLYTTNENWKVVSLKEARDFSNDKKCIYVFKKLEWESLSVDLLPHPDMFADPHLMLSENGENKRDDDGAKRLFFGGERFLEGISGHAYITIQRTEQNSPLGLEVQLHITEAVCPSLSEPGLRALLRFLTGLYVCLNRGDMDPKAQQGSTEAAGRSLVSIIVDHVFLCIKDAEFQLELLMQSLFFSRASLSDGEKTKNLSRVMVGGFFLRDTFSHPPCTLVQPSMHAIPQEPPCAPSFGENFCPPIYPLDNHLWQLNENVPLISLYSHQIKPSPVPPCFASQTVVNCQPLMINLQEESCLRIVSFLADGITVNPGDVLPDFSINYFMFNLKEFDLSIPLKITGSNPCVNQYSFSGARLHVKDLLFSQSPTLKFKLLNLEKDPACFCMWRGQPIDSSQKKWTTRASHLHLSLMTFNHLKELQVFSDQSMSLWRCVELEEPCFEAAMVTTDGSPLTTVPPPGGIIRIGIACQQYLSNTSIDQLFFVFDLYAYFGKVSEKVVKVGKSKKQRNHKKHIGRSLIEKIPCDTAVSLSVNNLHLKFLESSSENAYGIPLVQFVATNLFVRISHRTLGGAIAISSNLVWESVQVDCVDADENPINLNAPENGFPPLKTVFWINNKKDNHYNPSISKIPFLSINTVHVIPYDSQDEECHSLNLSAEVFGVRLGGGMNYTEALLHRFGILGLDGGPSEGLSKGLKDLSHGPLSKLFSTSSLIEVNSEDEIDRSSINGNLNGFLELGKPDNVDISIELKDWLFALEEAQSGSSYWSSKCEDINREERCWHTTFQSVHVWARSDPMQRLGNVAGKGKLHRNEKYPVEFITVTMNGLQALKPDAGSILHHKTSFGGINQDLNDLVIDNIAADNCGGINLEVNLVISGEDEIENIDMPQWVVEKLKFSVKQPIEAVATKEELEHLVLLCRSEIDSMGRITAGILRVLNLDQSIGQPTINQLSNLGSEGFDKIFKSRNISRRSSIDSVGFTPSVVYGNPDDNIQSTINLLENSISDSQSKCLALIDEFHNPSLSPKYLADMKQLKEKVDSLQVLLSQLRTQI